MGLLRLQQKLWNELCDNIDLRMSLVGLNGNTVANLINFNKVYIPQYPLNLSSDVDQVPFINRNCTCLHDYNLITRNKDTIVLK